MSSPNVVVNVSTPELLQQIEDQFGIPKGTILRAIAIKSVGHELINAISLDGTASSNIFSEDIVPLLPNSRMAVFFGITFTGTTPTINWITKQGSVSKTSQPLSTITLITGGLYQFDIVASKKLKYNMQATQDSSFQNVLVVEYAIGL